MNYYEKYLKYKNKYNKLLNNQSGGTYSFVSFNEIDDNPTLKSQFISDLKFYSESQDRTAEILHDIITSQKKKVKLVFYQHTFTKYSQSDVYLIMINGFNDDILIDLAKKCFFPRGFPIIWKPNDFCNLYGFYPKFENDKIEEESEDILSDELTDIESIDFNYKYSGYLGQVIAFKINEDIYYTVCAKKSTNNIFSDNCFRIIQSKMTPALLDTMISQNIHFSGECLAFFDQVHGAKVEKENLVITSVGIGHWMSYSQPDTPKGHIYTPLIDSTNYFVTFYNQRDTLEFCKTYNLAVDKIFQIISKDSFDNTISQEYNTVIDFLLKLSNIRNIITLKMFSDFYDSEKKRDTHSSFNVMDGTIDHFEYLGDVLEGLIIKIKYNESSQKPKKTIKYKFPNYTIRTMFLREFIKKGEKIDEFTNLYNSYVKRWVVNDKINGKNYWKYIGMCLYNDYVILSEHYNEYLLLAKSNEESIIGKHIFMMDKVNERYKYYPEEKYDELCQEMEKHKLQQINANASIVFILGPIGGGKSTIGNLMKNICNRTDKYIHIDCDELDLGSEDVLLLGTERTDYTKWNLNNALINNKIPIISMGGGNIATRIGSTNGYTFIDDINEMMHTTVNFNSFLFLPHDKPIFEIFRDIDMNTFVEILNKTDISEFKDMSEDTTDNPYIQKINLLKKLYSDKGKIEKTIKQRNWLGKNKVEEILKKTKDNLQFVKKISEYLHKNKVLNEIIFYPYVTTENYVDIVPRMNQSNICDILYELPMTNNFMINSATFAQKRILCKYTLNDQTKFGHITLEYNVKKNIKYDLSNYELSQTKGHYYKIYPNDIFNNFNSILEEAKRVLLENYVEESKIYIDYIDIFLSKSFYEKMEELNKDMSPRKNLMVYLIKKKYNIQNKEKISQPFDKLFSDIKPIEFIRIFRFDKNLILNHKKNVTLIVNDQQITESFTCSQYGHITVDPGSHSPADMIFANIAVSLKKNTVNIKNKIYQINGCEYKEVNVTQLKIFYL